MSDGITDIMEQRDRIISAFEYLLHLHSCEQEGITSGQPEPKDWFKAVDDAWDALTELKEML